MTMNKAQADQLIEALEVSLAITERNAEHKRSIFLDIYRGELKEMIESGIAYYTDSEIWRKIKDYATSTMKEKEVDIPSMLEQLEYRFENA